MTYTIIVFAWRKPGTTPDQFKHHYETFHIPLVRNLTGSKFPISHTRRYILRAPVAGETAGQDSTSNAAHPPVVILGTAEDFDYDAYAELIFEDESKFQEFFAAVSEPEVAAEIAEDEERFLDRVKLKVAVVGERFATERP